MNHRFAIVGSFGVLIAIGIPFYLASQMGIGTYATSPQTLEVPLGSKKLIGGGRAKLWFAGGSSGGDFEISCKNDAWYLSPEPNEEYEACRVKVKLLKVHQPKGKSPSRGEFLVTWETPKK